MTACTGEEILEETLRQLRFDSQLAAIKASSMCVPCYMPYVNNIWLPRSRGDRPPPVPEGATNLGLIGQYVEVPREIAFTIECSVRTAWEAIYRLLQRGPAPPPVGVPALLRHLTDVRSQTSEFRRCLASGRSLAGAV